MSQIISKISDSTPKTFKKPTQKIQFINSMLPKITYRQDTLNTSLHSALLTHQCLHLFNYHAT